MELLEAVSTHLYPSTCSLNLISRNLRTQPGKTRRQYNVAVGGRPSLLEFMLKVSGSPLTRRLGCKTLKGTRKLLARV